MIGTGGRRKDRNDAGSVSWFVEGSYDMVSRLEPQSFAVAVVSQMTTNF
jgi:hypothetical protein